MGHLIQHERQQDRRGETEEELQTADGQRVGYRAAKGGCAESLVKIIQPAPGAAEDAFADFEILEGDDNAGHRDIFKDEKIKNHR